jgi:hypothetical protein
MSGAETAAPTAQQKSSIMRVLFATALCAVLAGSALAEDMKVFPNGSRPSLKGPEATFTGPVRVDM